MDEAYLRDLIAQATVDCYDEYEAFWGLLATLEDELSFPFSVTILGDKVKVMGIGEQSSERRGILVDLEKKGRMYAFPLSEIDIDELEGEAAAWVAAYQLWSR
jgi:hypothetical protein